MKCSTNKTNDLEEIQPESRSGMEAPWATGSRILHSQQDSQYFRIPDGDKTEELRLSSAIDRSESSGLSSSISELLFYVEVTVDRATGSRYETRTNASERRRKSNTAFSARR